MKKILLIICALLFSLLATAEERYEYLKQIPILHEGRIKPLDTYARVTLKEYLQKESLKEVSATQWLFEVLFDQKEAYNRKIFKINNPEVQKIMNLTPVKGHTYSFIEVFSALGKIEAQVTPLLNLDKEELTPEQKQLVDLFSSVYKYLNLSRSFSMLMPEMEITNRELAQILVLPANEKLSYFDLIQSQWRLRDYFKSSDFKNQELMKEASQIIQFFKFIEEDKFAIAFKILPPREIPSGEKFVDLAWRAPWELDFSKPSEALALNRWQELFRARNADDSNFITNSKAIFEHSVKVSEGSISSAKLWWEVKYNQFKLFNVAFSLYLLGFLVSMAYVITEKKKLRITGIILVSIGAFLHLINLSIRCYLLARPPVSNLYESIIFVALIGVLFALAMEKFRYQYSTVIGSLLGWILLLVSFGYEKEGDSMGMLVAVLDTNFWLSAHVITISIGYGCVLVTSAMAHLFLYQKTYKNSFKGQQLKKQIHYCSLFSLFFVIIGTMLGGIWADQSWGRFWGWDPKENGALLICLWLLWAVHGKIGGFLKENIYMTLIALSSVIVILAWFGVNLLNVGLHSYGFTANIAYNILGFVIAEILVIGFLLLKLYLRTDLRNVPDEIAYEQASTHNDQENAIKPV